jgi:hypothetical protein
MWHEAGRHLSRPARETVLGLPMQVLTRLDGSPVAIPA